ncbi:alpha/beta hydrolase [Dokdonia sp.]|uniref:alpha/beta fold hydrolase n=1 Tax=Dokdonia sp. TaxID=2024995 RepID=UPI003264E154
MKIIFIPGLGYDHRIFKSLELSYPMIAYLDWIDPKKGEHIHAYAQRLFSKIKDDAQDIVLIGHSLGGIVAQEIASVHKIHKVILLSSITSRKEMPFSFRIAKPLRLDLFFTKEISIHTINYWGKSHGFETKSDKQLFKDMVGLQSNRYLQWALRELSSWHAPKLPNTTQLIQIHGTRDKTFPIKHINHPDIIIEQGTHIFVYKQAKKTTDIIHKILK